MIMEVFVKRVIVYRDPLNNNPDQVYYLNYVEIEKERKNKIGFNFPIFLALKYSCLTGRYIIY
jgi:hypothetical protein